MKKGASKYNNRITTLCRIEATTPQSANVEQAVKVNNVFKITFCNRMNLETENKDTYVYNNCIEKFKMFQNEQLLIFRGLFYIGDYIDDSE